MSDPSLIEVARYRVIFVDCDPMRLVEIGWTELLRKLGHAPRSFATAAWYHQPVAFEARVLCCCMEVPSAARARRGTPLRKRRVR